jgi:recombination protein RecA
MTDENKSAQEIANRALTLVLNEINGVKGKNRPAAIKIDYLGRMLALDVPVIPSGSVALDLALGVGGYPRGRIIEIFGAESTGKSTLCLHAIVEAQKLGLICAYIDIEGTVDPGYATAIGVDTSKLLFSQPDNGDEGMRTVDKLVCSGLIGLIVIDSVAALTTAAELEKEITDTNIGQQARLMSQALKRLTVECNKTKTTLMFTNQIRNKIGVMYGSPETTSGGNALKYYATQRVKISRGESLKSGDNVTGNASTAHVIKNKVAAPFKKAFFEIEYGFGINKEKDAVATAADLGIITRAGAWYSYNGEQIGQGLERSLDYIKEHNLVPEIREKVLEAIKSGPRIPVDLQEQGEDEWEV